MGTVSRFHLLPGSLWKHLGVVVVCIATLVVGTVLAGPSMSASPEMSSKAASISSSSTQSLRLSLDEAIGLFLRQNLDLLIAKFGIESRKGQEITARLFPNPVAFIGTQSSYTST